MDSFYNKYVYSGNETLIRVDSFPLREFSPLGGYVEERIAGNWVVIPHAGGGLEHGTDRVFQYVREYVPEEDLSEAAKKLIPPRLHGRGDSGYYRVSQLGAGPFRFEGIELSRDQLVTLSSKLRPHLIGVSCNTNELGLVSLHEAGDAWGEWREVYFSRFQELATEAVETMQVTLYDTENRQTREQKTYVGYKGSGPEVLVPLRWFIGDAVRYVLDPATQKLLERLCAAKALA